MRLTSVQIDQAFEGKKNQHDVLLEIYKLVYRDWNSIERICGYPTVGKALSDYIWERFRSFDEYYHPDVIKGGLWLNKGFSTNEKLNAWKVDLSTAEVYYKKEVNDEDSY